MLGSTRISQLRERLDALEARLADEVARAGDEREIDAVRTAFLGRTGEITRERRTIGTLPPDERPGAGNAVNAVVERCAAIVDERARAIRLRAFDVELARTVDVTFAPIAPRSGSIHPLRRTMQDVCDFFASRGFAVVLGPEIETEAYNFDALNIPGDHPAREGLDSFYLRPGLVLRTHTSPVQVRTMRAHEPPIAVVVPGRVYRRDAVDARHSYAFHQIEGLLAAPGIHFGHLKGMIAELCRALFGADQAVRFRPSYFPFTEPSAEVDTTCPACAGAGGACRTCGGSGWIEIAGAGLVHPNVLRASGYDPEVVSGWAFGVGLERIAMVRHGIDDIRAFYDGDPAFSETLA